MDRTGCLTRQVVAFALSVAQTKKTQLSNGNKSLTKKCFSLLCECFGIFYFAVSFFLMLSVNFTNGSQPTL